MAKTRRLGLIIPWALFAFAVVGWIGYWNVLAGAAKTRLEAAIAQERAAGAEISYTAMRTRGFPLQLAFAFDEAAYAPEGRPFRLTTAELLTHVNVLNPQHLIVSFPAPVDAQRADATSRISGEDMLLSVRMAQGRLARASFEAKHLRIDDLGKPGDGLVIASALIHARPDARPNERAIGAYQIALSLEGLTLQEPVKAFEPLGATIETIGAAIVLERASALAGAPRGDVLGPWADVGGLARIEGLSLVWGAARASGQGSLSVDEERRPLGAIALRLDNPGETLRALQDGPSLSGDAKQALRIAALAFSASGDDLEARLRAADGWLTLGPARLRPLAPLYRPR